MIKTTLITAIIATVFHAGLFAQMVTEIQSAAKRSTNLNASPQATAFGIYGQVPVSHYTGTPQVNISLYNMAYRELGVDLSLMYHQAIGNKPDLFPGYYGNGWLLTTGGVITCISRAERPYDNGLNPIPNAVDPTKDGNWSATSKLDTLLKGRGDIIGGASIRYDEFSYNFGNYAGKFYLDDDDTIKIRTAQGEDLKIKIELLNTEIKLPREPQDSLEQLVSCMQYTAYTTTLQSAAPMFPYRFTVIASNGVKYVFGGTPEAIDIARPGTRWWDEFSYDFNPRNVLPSSWYLTSIESPNGYKISLEYKRGNFYVTSEINHSGRIFHIPNHGGGNDGNLSDLPPTALVIRSTLFNPCYLDKIVTPTSTAQFYWSKADKQLRYKFLPPRTVVSNSTSFFYFSCYLDVGWAFMNGRFPNKLDSFKVSASNGSRVQAVEFNYTSDTATRLKLLSVKSKGKGGPGSASVYSFSYNPLPLPEYLSMETDKYGFYNGRNYFSYLNPILGKEDTTGPYRKLFTDSVAKRDSFIQSKEPDSNFTRAEILERITYPTGGYTTYEYENNSYSKYVDSWPALVINHTADSITGGLRIRRMCNYDYNGHKTGEKLYRYVANYAHGGQRSSGVLSYRPIFYREYDSIVIAKPKNMPSNYAATHFLRNYKEWATTPINRQNYNEPNFINYSEVAEVNLDNSYKVFKYQNHDNGFLDKPVVNMATDNDNIPSWKGSDENNLSLERGLLHSEEIYDSSGVCKVKTLYGYNDDTLRFNKHVRFIKAYPNILFAKNDDYYSSLRYVAYYHYTYYPFLKKRTQTEYPTPGDSIVTASTYTYDTNDRLLKTQSTANSSNKTILLANTYPKDIVARGDTVPYKKMLIKNITGAVIEQERYVDSILESKSVVEYANFVTPKDTLILPLLTKTQKGSGPLEVVDRFYKYDRTGNPVSFSKDGDIKTYILWSYSNSLPVAKIVNVEDSTVATVLGGQQFIDEIGKRNPEPAALQELFQQLRASSLLAGSFITTYTYDLLTGLTSETGPEEKTIYYEYDKMGRLTVIRDHNKKIVRKICYNYSGQAEECSVYTNVHAIAELARAGALSDFCSPPTNALLQFVTAHFPVFDTDSMPEALAPDFFYNTGDMQTFIPDGYYRPARGNRIGNLYMPAGTYLYIKNGRILYIGHCGYPEPHILQYSDTLLPLSQICNAALPEKGVFTTGWAHLYTNYLHTGTVADGYYIRGNEVLHVDSGIITSIDTCYTLLSMQVHKDSTKKAACLYFGFLDSLSHDSVITVHYKNNLDYGTVLFSDSVMATPLLPGFYSNGSMVYTVDSLGRVVDSLTCVEAILGAVWPIKKMRHGSSQEDYACYYRYGSPAVWPRNKLHAFFNTFKKSNYAALV